MAQETQPEVLSGIQKASLLLVALGTDAASSVLQRLSPEEVKVLGSQIAKIRNVEPTTKDTVLKEFVTRHSTGSAVQGSEYVRQILETALGSAKAQDLATEIFADTSDQPFDWLKSVGTPRLAACLSSERPQVIAVVLAYVSPLRAADVVSQLPEQIQGEVAYRLGYMQSVSPETAVAIEEVLETKLAREGNVGLKSVGGVNSLVAILNNADRATEMKILDYLETLESGVAESIREMLFVFEDLAKLDDPALQMIVQEIQQEDLRLALKGCQEPLRVAFFRNMSERAAEAMKEDLEMMGRVKVRDVEAAQRRIMAVVRHLDEAGTISIRAGGEEFVT